MKKRPKHKGKDQSNYKLFLFKDKINRGGEKRQGEMKAQTLKMIPEKYKGLLRLLWQLYANKLNSI